MAPNKRQSMWQSRRVFFLTPQVLQNDLNRGSCKAEEVVLLVADEAHKALGNHAYCQVRQIMLWNHHVMFISSVFSFGQQMYLIRRHVMTKNQRPKLHFKF